MSNTTSQVTKKEELINLLKANEFTYDLISNLSTKEINNIYKILINGIIKNYYPDTQRNNFAAIYYVIHNNIGNAERYYLRNINMGCVTALNNYATLLEAKGDKKSAEKYYIMATNKGHVLAYVNYARFLIKKGRLDEAKKFYLKAIDAEDVNAMYQYALIQQKKNNIDDAKKYYIMAINKNSSKAMIAYGKILESENDLVNAKKYFQLAINSNEKPYVYEAMFLYAKLCDDTENHIAKQYFLQCIKNGNLDAFQLYMKLNPSLLETYIELCDTTNDDIKKELVKMESDDKVKKYIDNNKDAKYDIEWCTICMKDGVKTFHFDNNNDYSYCCSKCYLELNK